MLKKLQLTFSLITVALGFSVLSEPINSAIASEETEIIEPEEVENLWVWPDEMISQKASPTTVWTPLTGIWYSGVAVNGYSNTSFYPARTFTDSSYHNLYAGGYAMVQFFELESGRYNLVYDFIGGQNTDNMLTYIIVYEEVNGGYVFARNNAIRRTILNHGDFKSASGMFDVTEDKVLIGIWISTHAGSNECDIWNVVLTKVEE